MDRLTKVMSCPDGAKIYDVSNELFKANCSRADKTRMILEKLAEYEDLEEQGRLTKLPCKVEDILYGISMGKIINLTINEISIFCMKGEKIINVKCQSNDEFRNYVEGEFGKTVFLSKEEAKARLKELRNIENRKNINLDNDERM